jgi:MFS family permease
MSSQQPGGCDPDSHANDDECPDPNHQTPLPVKQLVVLAIIALAEQTALNSISPYLPEMAATFPEVAPERVGLYVGVIASCFAAAQVTSNFFWGWLSDRIGRKPVILIGTTLTIVTFLLFGFSKNLWQAILIQVFLGLVNGDAGIVNSCLGELTDRSNQSAVFGYLPVLYGLGGITGPLIGGTLAHRSFFNGGKATTYPYLLPNLVAACVLVVDLFVVIFFFEETLENNDGISKFLKKTIHHIQQPSEISRAIHRAYYSFIPSNSTPGPESEALLRRESTASISSTKSTKPYLNANVILILGTYLVFQLSNIAFNALFPIFTSSKAPTGRDLSPVEIGLSQAFAGMVGIVFQACLFAPFRKKLGNKWTYRSAFLAFIVAFMLMPWVGYKSSKPPFKIADGKIWLWFELGGILLIKTLATVGGLATALLLVR